MNKLQKRVQQRGQGGFTLIELLVVIAILAILAGVVVFAVGNSTDNAKVTACKAEAKTLTVAANAAKAQHLNETSITTSYKAYVDAGSFTTASGVDSFKYFTVTETLTGTPQVVFAAIGTPPCAVPSAVTY